MKRFSRLCMIVFVCVYVIIIAGCSNQYYKGKTITKASAFPATINQAIKDKRYFVMYSGVNTYSVANVEMDKAKPQMTVQLDKVDSLHQVYVSNNQSMRYKPNEVERASVSDILIYMKDSTSYTLDEPHTILLENIDRIKLVR